MSAADTKSPKDPSGDVGDVIRPSSRTTNEQDTENIEKIDNSLHDVGYGYFLESQDMDPVLRDEIVKRVLKKIDFCLLPAVSDALSSCSRVWHKFVDIESILMHIYRCVSSTSCRSSINRLSTTPMLRPPRLGRRPSHTSQLHRDSRILA